MNPSLVDKNLAVTGRSDDDGWIVDPVLQIIKYYETRMYLREMWSIFARYGEDSTDRDCGRVGGGVCRYQKTRGMEYFQMAEAEVRR